MTEGDEEDQMTGSLEETATNSGRRRSPLALRVIKRETKTTTQQITSEELGEFGSKSCSVAIAIVHSHVSLLV